VRAGLNASPVRDSKDFHSIYYRELSGVLFEITSDSPRFTVDESVERLGTALMAPKQFESHRSPIERVVPPVKLLGEEIAARHQ
jgi:glyoxalase family protein